MRILHLSKTMDQGGAEKVVYQLASACKEKNIFVAVASRGGVYVKELNQMGIAHYEIDDFDSKGIRVLFRTFAILSKVIKKEKISIVHSHHRMAAFYAFLLKMRFPRLKMVYTAHNVFFDKRFLTRASISVGKVIAVGENVKKNLVDFFKVNEKKISVIYNAVIEESNKEADVRSLVPFDRENDIVVGIIGRLSEQKGIDIYLRAMKIAWEREPRIKGIIVGDGELFEEVRTQIDELGMKNVIHMAGYQKRVVALIRELDFVVMPSRWEGFPLTPIEVFMAGKTLVGSNIGGINEIVENEVNGFLVEMDDYETFAEKILELAHDTSLRSRMECAGMEKYKKDFAYHKFVDKYVSIYETIIK